MAMHRTKAAVVGGPVEYTPTASLTWLNGNLDGEDGPKGVEKIHQYLATTKLLRAAEGIAIRLAMHLGDTGAPVNSVGTSAWATNRAEDWAAYAVARRLRGPAGGIGALDLEEP